MKVKEILNVRRYKAGFEIRKEIWSNGEDTLMRAAYTPSGDYIGDPQWAQRLVVQRGIQPQKKTPESSVCSIGYSVKDGKWYGWSHRAIFGFKVGSKCKKGDCHYRPVDKDDFWDDMLRFWDGEDHLYLKGTHTKEGVLVEWTYSDKVPNESMRGTLGGCVTEYPDEYGKGEWVAETTEDAKQMAIDFASGVS